jgi:hypothetical protein
MGNLGEKGQDVRPRKLSGVQTHRRPIKRWIRRKKLLFEPWRAEA